MKLHVTLLVFSTPLLASMTINLALASPKEIGVRYQETVERKVEQICGTDENCAERTRGMMNERYERYRSIRLEECGKDKACKADINKKFPSTN